MISLIGGVAPRWIKANGSIDVIVNGEAHVVLGLGKLKSKAKSAASKTVTKNTTKAEVIKGDKTMKTISSIFNGVGKASSLPGE
jgi:hypothetical protein